MIDGLRLAVGTLTVFPVAPPRIVNRRTGGWAMTFAPLVGLLLAVAASIPQWLLGWSPVGEPPSLVMSALTIGLLALLTRAMHLDGLADTVDGLGSGKPAADALAVMRHGDIGPFGVVTLVLALLVQVAALAELVAVGHGPGSIAVALIVSRLILPVVCSRGIPPALPQGLGQAVAGSVSRLQLLLAAGLACVAALGWDLAGLDAGPDVGPVSLLVVATAALVAGTAFGWWCVRRLGGVTGDMMGACVETTFTVALVALALL